MLCSLTFALATLESKLCRDVWQAWPCEQPVTKHMSNPKSVVSKADVYICAGRIPGRPHHCDAQTDEAPSSGFADHVG